MVESAFGAVSLVVAIGQTTLALVGAATAMMSAVGSTRKVLIALKRFGLSLHKRKIHVVSASGTFASIKQDLVDSGLITERNVVHIDDKHLSNVGESLLTIVVYGYLDDAETKRLLHSKKSGCGMIVYCAPGSGKVGDTVLDALNKEPFTTLCNFRGRLVNDVLLMMLSTSFSKKDALSN